MSVKTLEMGKTFIVMVPLLCAVVWYEVVHEIVEEPYLDEEFHIRQAQHYLKGNWRVWDPKLTTPPGLYLASWILTMFSRTWGVEEMVAKEGRDLRIINLLGAFAIGKVLIAIMDRLHPDPLNASREEAAVMNFRRRHTVANILFFPVMFFFYGMYYTDVLSTLSVLVTYLYYLKGQRVWTFLFGLVSLWFRQTNVFWSGIYLGALELRRTLVEGPTTKNSDKEATSHAAGYLHDPLMADAVLADYALSTRSLVARTLTDPWRIVSSCWAQLSIISVFALFVLWNGGVVLGDKNNHIASLHFAQMLYIWPYISFFSDPLTGPFFLQLFMPVEALQSSFRPRGKTLARPRLTFASFIILLMAAVVNYNSIIHPFTLADNRHYMFYVFRLLNRLPYTKFLAIPAYFGAAWIVLAALAEKSDSKSSSATAPSSETAINSSKTEIELKEKYDLESPTVSWVMIWLGTTALSLCTAPLVEPRYCILPWLIWRLHLPLQVYKKAASSSQGSEAADSQHSTMDYRLWRETAWLLAINIFTGYMFLYRGFEWKQEPGKVQRFMW